MLLTDFINALSDRLYKHEDNRYHLGEDVLGPCEIYIDIFGKYGYKGYSPEIITFIDGTNGNVVISAMEEDQTVKGPHGPLFS